MPYNCAVDDNFSQVRVFITSETARRGRGPSRNEGEVLCGLRASKASTLRSRRYSVRSVLRV